MSRKSELNKEKAEAGDEFVWQGARGRVVHEAGFIDVLEDCCGFSPLGNRCSERAIKICQVSVNRGGSIFFLMICECS